jgi:hypothetical protein
LNCERRGRLKTEVIKRKTMATKHAGMGAAFVALALVLGLMTIIGVILLMMWFQPGIEHSPSEGHSFTRSQIVATTQACVLSHLALDLVLDSGAST